MFDVLVVDVRHILNTCKSQGYFERTNVSNGFHVFGQVLPNFEFFSFLCSCYLAFLMRGREIPF